MTAELLTKEAVEFGERVTLYRVIDADTGKGTLWHRDADRAWTHFQRLFRGTATPHQALGRCRCGACHTIDEAIELNCA